MSKLNQLAQKIRSLPDIQTERARISVVRHVIQDVKEVTDGLTATSRQAKYIDLIAKPQTKMVAFVEEATSFAVGQAKNLKKLIQRDKFGSEQKISEHLENLKKKQQAVESQRDNVWSRVKTEAQPIQTIFNIASALKLNSVTVLDDAIINFRRATNSPPSSSTDVEKVMSAREICKTAVQNSGLTGNVKIILEGAISANGDPRLLLEDDVKQFLENHPELWGSLKLKLA